MKRMLIISILITLLIVPLLHAQILEHGFREDFETLASWKPLTFPKIPRHSAYSILKEDGKSMLVAVADNSASGLIYTKSFNIYQTPIIRWKWRVSNIFQAGDAKKKSGDDYPLRIYVVFNMILKRQVFSRKPGTTRQNSFTASIRHTAASITSGRIRNIPRGFYPIPILPKRK